MDDWQLELRSKNPELMPMVAWFDTNPELIPPLLNGLTSSNDTFRFNTYSLVQQICKSSPQIVYPYWNQIAHLLKSKNNYERSIAVRLLALLCSVDENQYFESIREAYFGLLRGESIMTARFLIQSVADIFKSKPDLQEDLVNILLHIELHTNLIPERIELMKTDILVCFEEIFYLLKNQVDIINFAKQALTSQSPKIRKQAKIFLKNHSKQFQSQK